MASDAKRPITVDAAAVIASGALATFLKNQGFSQEALAFVVASAGLIILCHRLGKERLYSFGRANSVLSTLIAFAVAGGLGALAWRGFISQSAKPSVDLAPGAQAVPAPTPQDPHPPTVGPMYSVPGPGGLKVQATEPILQSGKLTLLDLFKRDNDNTLRMTAESRYTRDGKSYVFPVQAYLDHRGLAWFSGFFIQAGFPAKEIALAQRDHVEEIFTFVKSNYQIDTTQLGQLQRTKLDELRFTGRVLIYHEDFLSARDIADIEDAYKTRKLSVLLFGPDYLAGKSLGK